MDFEVQTLRGLAVQRSDIVYAPLCDAEVSVSQPPRVVFGECTQGLMSRYFRQNYTAPVGVYTASNTGVFGEALLIHGDTLLACDEIEMTAEGLAVYRARYQAMRGLL